MIGRRVLAVGCGAVLALAGSAVASAVSTAAAPKTETVSSGIVTATFSYTTGKYQTYPTKTLTISRSGQVVYDQPASSKFCGTANEQLYCAPGYGAAGKSVHIVALQPGVEPNVLLDLYTGGAHCCSVEQVFTWDPATGTYFLAAEHDFGDPGAQVLDLGHDGVDEFETADDTFAYAFSAYAGSGLPIQILRFTGKGFANVTKQYPKLITRDAAYWLKTAKQVPTESDGFIAAWAADEDNLGRQRLVKTTLAKYLKAGKLRGAQFRNGRQFLNALNKLLKRDGYVH